MPAHFTLSRCEWKEGGSSAGFSLRGLVLARTKPHRLKPALLKRLSLGAAFVLHFFWLRRIPPGITSDENG